MSGAHLTPPSPRSYTETFWPRRLAVRTPAFHAGSTGSSPVGVTFSLVFLWKNEGFVFEHRDWRKSEIHLRQIWPGVFGGPFYRRIQKMPVVNQRF